MKTNCIVLLLMTSFCMSCSKEFLNNCDSKSRKYLAPKAAFKINQIGQSQVITFNNESVNADTYEWDFGNGKTSTLQSPEEVTYIENKTYNVKLIVKRCGNEKTDMFSASVKIDCPTVVAPTITKNITNPCEGQEVILSSSCPSGNTLFWNDGTSATTLKVTKTDTYTALCKNTTTGCQSNKATQTITFNTLPIKPTITNSLNKIVYCTGETLPTLSATCPIGNITWSTGASSSSITIQNAGTYSATCTVSSCTAKSDNIIITVNSKPGVPNITVGPSQICIGSSVSITASGCSGGTIIWSNGKTGGTMSETISSDKSFTATCTQGNCVSDISNSHSVIAIPLASITTGSYKITGTILNYAITFNGSINFNTTGTNGYVNDYGFVWIEGTGTPTLSIKDGLKSFDLKKESSGTDFPYSLSNQITNKFSYRAYITRCDGSTIYGLVNKTF